MNMKRIVVFALALVMLASSVVGATESVVQLGLPADPGDLGPFSGMSAGRVHLLKTMYETLVDRNDFGGEFVGVIMKDYVAISETEYEMTIYDYVYDQAGNHLTAADVAFCYNTAKSLGNLPKLNQITSIEATGDYTLKFVFTSIRLGDLATLWSEVPIVTQAAYEASPDSMAITPITTAPYKVTRYTSGSVLVYEKVDYWQHDASKVAVPSLANVDKIVYQMIPEPSMHTIALQTGQIDISTSVPATDLPGFRTGRYADGFMVTELGKNLTDMMQFNLYEGNPFTNEALRKAVAYAIDNNGFVAGALNGQGRATKIPGNPNFPDFNYEWDGKYYEFDLVKAKQLLAEAGYKPGELTITVMSQADAIAVREAQIVQAMLQELGINVEIASYQGPLFNSYKLDPTKWDLLLNQAASTDYIVNVWKFLWDNTAYQHGTSSFFSDDHLQTLLMTACSIEGHTQENVDAFLDYFMEKCYAIGIVQQFDSIVHSTNVTQLKFDARGFVIPGACEYDF